jgi:predicted nuclease of predicted toxin-antitoxin system
MKHRFLVDTQLPLSLVGFFEQRGFNASHIINYPAKEFTPDSEVIAIAVAESRIIVSKDRDFFDYFLIKGYPPAILLLQVGNIKNQDLFQLLDTHLLAINKLFIERIQRMVLLNRNSITVYERQAECSVI